MNVVVDLTDEPLSPARQRRKRRINDTVSFLAASAEYRMRTGGAMLPEFRQNANLAELQPATSTPHSRGCASVCFKWGNIVLAHGSLADGRR